MTTVDAIFNISKRSMMTVWHQLDSSRTMPEQQKSTKIKTLKPSSMSFWFSTGLLSDFRGSIIRRVRIIIRKVFTSNS